MYNDFLEEENCMDAIGQIFRENSIGCMDDES